jgi:FkbM family methyltransferase
MMKMARWGARWFVPPAPARYLKRLIPQAADETLLEMERLAAAPRYARLTTTLPGHTTDLTDAYAFLAMYDEIYRREVYRFETHEQSPLVIDGGANIGLCIRFTKDIYPGSRIVAFEPDPDVFSVLAHNVAAWHLNDVELHERALWKTETVLEFEAEGGYAGRLAPDGSPGTIRVKTIRLREFLVERVAFLKLDIEGAETDVLLDCADLLGNVENIAVEYHSFANSDQSLHTVLGLLHDAGFRVAVHMVSAADRPLVEKRVLMGFDLQLNIFGWRKRPAEERTNPAEERTNPAGERTSTG